MEQHEITQAGPLLDDQGNLREAGYARRMLPVYDRNDVKGHTMRIKEWDYYLVMNGQFALALTIADNSYMGLDSISLLDFWENTQITKSPMRLLPMGSTGMPSGMHWTRTSSSPMSRRSPWSSAPPLTSPATSILTKRSTVCGLRAR